MSQDSVPAPSVKLSSFACPVCGAHSAQTWFATRLDRIVGDTVVPYIPSADEVAVLDIRVREIKDEQKRALIQKYTEIQRRALIGDPFIEKTTDSVYNSPILHNVHVSSCFTCGDVSIWLRDSLLYPSKMTGAAPNPDLSPDVKHDYQEARKIVELSPRGAAALLRLAIEKICLELKAEGRDINEQIAFLVSKGLPQQVQQALDTVRVIGNEAVHPGKLDLRDDHETAIALFGLVNFIAQEQISRPKQLAELYQEKVPENKRKAIDQRNAKATSEKK